MDRIRRGSPEASDGRFRIFRYLAVFTICCSSSSNAEPPGISYIYPAGVQCGTKTEVRVGGFYFHGEADFEMSGSGVKASPKVVATETIWFEGPMIFQPLSQRSEDYPKDHVGKITAAADAPPGLRSWQCRTSQGITTSLPFVIGDLPEIIEEEIDGEPIPRTVTLPLTINGRIFPREDVDLWNFQAKAGQIIVCDVDSQKLGSLLEAILSITGPDGRAVAVSESSGGIDPFIWFEAEKDGEYQLKIHDANFKGLQSFVYRLSIRNGPAATWAFPLGGARGETIQVEVGGPGFKEPVTFPVSLAGVEGDSVTVPVEVGGVSAGSITLRVDDLPEVHQVGASMAVPSIANGRIVTPGEVNSWPIELAEKQTVLLQIEAEKLGSRLESFVTIADAEGKELAKNDDGVPGQPDSRLLFTAPKAGTYSVNVREQFASRGGPEFGFRLKVTGQEPIDFGLILNKDAVTVAAGDPDPPELTEEEAKAALRAKRKRGTGLLVTLDPMGAFKSDVMLEIAGLPEGVSVAEDLLKLSARKKSIELFFDAEAGIPVQLAEITVRGTAEIIEGDPKKAKKGEEVKTRSLTRVATIPVAFGQSPVEKVRIAVAPHVPFRHQGQYRVTSGRPGGSTWVKQYEIDRGGFEGPLTVQLADRQLRHLQGTRGPVIEIPAGIREFDYPIVYAANPELGRTSRVQLMISGEMTDAEGKKHVVSYTSSERSDQIITINSDGLLRISTDQRTWVAVPNTRIEIPVRIQRDPSIASEPVCLELVLPEHFSGVTAEPFELKADQETATMVIELGADPGPFNQAVAIRGRTRTQGPAGHVAETLIELIPKAASLTTAGK